MYVIEASYTACLLIKAFLAILLMLPFLTAGWPGFMNQTYEVIEFFAGAGRISRLAAAQGWRVLVHDIGYDREASAQGRKSSMDMVTSAGFLPLDMHENNSSVAEKL